MQTKVHEIKLGFSKCYLLQGDGIILVDAGMPDKGEDFRKQIERLSIKPEEIRLIVLTHTHLDHVGSAAEIKEMTGAPIAIHTREKEWLEKAIPRTPPPANFVGRVVSLLSVFSKSFHHFPPAKADIEIGDEGFSLTEYGIPGKVFLTPGHSIGSLSVLLDTGEAMVGDLAAGSNFFTAFRPGIPAYAEDVATIKESWKLLLDHGMKTVYPAHGGSFSADVLKKKLAKG